MGLTVCRVETTEIGEAMADDRQAATIEATDDLPPCTRCGHPSDWHRLSSDAVVQDPTDDRARFRCLGYDCMVGGPATPACECPNYERWERS